MNADIQYIFSIPKRPQPRQYVAIWPCGKRWEFDRQSVDGLPIFADGKQTGAEIVATSLREAIAELENEGALVERA